MRLLVQVLLGERPLWSGQGGRESVFQRLVLTGRFLIIKFIYVIIIITNQAIMRIIFVSRDNGGAKQSVPLALLAMKKGHEVGIVVEGLAVDRFNDAGFFKSELKAKTFFKGYVSKPSRIEAGPILNEFKPDAVVITRSNLDSLENEFGLTANKSGIPVVLLEDYWAGHLTSRARPDLIVTLDEYAEELARKSHTNAKIIIAGNPAFISPDQAEIPFKVRNKFKELRAKFGRVFVYAGGERKQMTAELDLLSKCLRLTKNWCLIVRLHPLEAEKEKETGIKEGRDQDNLLKEFGERIVMVEFKMGDPLAILADATFSGSSTMLNTAAYARKASISIRTELGVKALKEIGLTELPLIRLKCVRQLRSPCNLDDLGFIQPAEESNLARLKPFDAGLALKAIEAIAAR